MKFVVTTTFEIKDKDLFLDVLEKEFDLDRSDLCRLLGGEEIVSSSGEDKLGAMQMRLYLEQTTQ